jgi:hypothetical protein
MKQTFKTIQKVRLAPLLLINFVKIHHISKHTFVPLVVVSASELKLIHGARSARQAEPADLMRAAEQAREPSRALRCPYFVKVYHICKYSFVMSLT